MQCSIDGLLDQTIKHMQYLRSVTDQAEKLRQWVHQEVCEVTSGLIDASCRSVSWQCFGFASQITCTN